MFDKEGFYKEVGIRLQLLRRRKDLTQQDVADGVGIPRASYANVERGRQTVALDLLWRLAVFFSVSIDDICPQPKKASAGPSSPAHRGADLTQSPVYIRQSEPTGGAA